jgi:hypothetical protein
MKLTTNQKKILDYLRFKSTWKSIKDIKKESNFRMTETSMRTILNQLFNKGLIMKQKNPFNGNLFEFIPTRFGKEFDGRLNQFSKQKCKCNLRPEILDKRDDKSLCQCYLCKKYFFINN